jgi:hypothetical protein
LCSSLSFAVPPLLLLLLLLLVLGSTTLFGRSVCFAMPPLRLLLLLLLLLLLGIQIQACITPLAASLLLLQHNPLPLLLLLLLLGFSTVLDNDSHNSQIPCGAQALRTQHQLLLVRQVHHQASLGL